MGTLSRRSPWCFSKGVGYMPAPGFTFSLFHIHNHHSRHTTPHTQYNTIHTLTHRSINWSRKPGLSAVGTSVVLTILPPVNSVLWRQPLGKPWPS
ncbi:hypothetical protein C0J52_11240 [Blattella germanica]|nr:hypothetical protein C0J52_11240 [Blattella germanica]